MTRTKKAAIAGVIAIVGGQVWERLYELYEARNFPRGWIVDVVPYYPANLLSWAGVAIVIGTGILVVLRLAYLSIVKGH